MNADSNLYVKSRIIPPPRKIEPSRRGLFKLTAGCPVEITVPAGKAEPSAMLYEAFAGNWRIRPELSWKNGGQEIPVDGYQLDIKPDQCGIAASTPGGVLNAVKTMRQLAESERGVLTLSGWQLPCITVEDAPALPFRGIHLCCFPETPTWEMEKYIRLAAYYKFNYAIIEPWGVFRFESHPEFCWEETAMEKADFIRLAALAARLGVTLIPQMNLFGHATASRCGSGKHVLLGIQSMLRCSNRTVGPGASPIRTPGSTWRISYWNCMTHSEDRRFSISAVMRHTTPAAVRSARRDIRKSFSGICNISTACWPGEAPV